MSTSIYAALTTIINSKFSNIGYLILKRLIIQSKYAFRKNDKPLCISSGIFIAHLLNQRVALNESSSEIMALQILAFLLGTGGWHSKGEMVNKMADGWLGRNTNCIFEKMWYEINWNF